MLTFKQFEELYSVVVDYVPISSRKECRRSLLEYLQLTEPKAKKNVCSPKHRLVSTVNTIGAVSPRKVYSFRFVDEESSSDS